MRKAIIVGFLLISLNSIPADGGEIEFCIRGSVSEFWNYWGDGFFFHTFSMDTVTENTVLDFNKIINSTLLINPELWISYDISDQFSIIASLKYQRLKYSFRDSLHMSWIRWHKTLDTELDFYSLGVGLQWHAPSVKPYVRLDFGYCHGHLSNSEIVGDPDSIALKYWILADGSGGGGFYNLIAGATFPITGRFSLFAEFEGRFRLYNWDSFAIKELHGDTEVPYVQQHDSDREIIIQGYMLTMGMMFNL